MTTIHTIERRPRAASAGPPPLLIMLHGYGSNERDLFDLGEYLDPRLHIVSARGVLNLGFGFAWYHLGGAPGNLVPDPETRARARDLLAKFVADLPGRLGTDPWHTYLLGFSQGAVMSLALAAHEPARLAGVIPLSGYLDPDSLDAPLPAAIADLPILQIHGTEDEVIPIAAARRTRDALAPLARRHTYQEYPVGHTISMDGLMLVRDWLAERLAT
ncbi:dienelactone hydrolase family protein [Oscillochloris sp. ZM17-4]|uniref:alpha/beta hydrolase n=1 Tax=Oscillochloris sp. ZM17-4 TaxID=2866714 RepID=UPI001C73757C|nr:alpha/beta hydrolase-fold protein [Oscillochloris sp. ZM17-4]MBX0327200.1 dienelactone hydrolase family protein [Oscillochloris sp. ZM17-4]